MWLFDDKEVPAIKTQLKVSLKRGKKGKRVLRVQIKPTAKGLTNVLGKIKVVFSKKVKGHWKAAHKYGSMAKGYDRKSKVFNVKLEKARWRVQVQYLGSPGYATSAKTLTLKV